VAPIHSEHVRPTFNCIGRREISSHFWDKKRGYLKDQIDELATRSKNMNIREFYRGINKFGRSYQSRNNLMMYVNDDLLRHFHNILTFCGSVTNNNRVWTE
jgi:hypothetical protein